MLVEKFMLQDPVVPLREQGAKQNYVIILNAFCLGKGKGRDGLRGGTEGATNKGADIHVDGDVRTISGAAYVSTVAGVSGVVPLAAHLWTWLPKP